MRRMFGAAVAACFFALGMHAQDPPARVARLNYVGGNVSMQPAGVNDWVPADLNRPFTTGDTLYSDAGSRAELHLDTAVVRAGEFTNFGFLTLADQAVQLRLTEGDLYITLRDLDPSQTFEIDTPNAAVSLLRTGVYRFRVASDGSLTFLVVRQGQAEVTGGGQAFTLTPGNSAAISGAGQLSYNVQPAPQPDDFDMWSQDRDAREAQFEAQEHLPPNVVGYEDMDQYGRWQNDDTYGQVWYPSTVSAGWAPYHYGHWAWIEPWGWTWIDDAPWGFAPFHYGRWAFISGRWGWCPGPIVISGYHHPVVRAVYAPALVAWFGGSHFGVGIAVGGGPQLGWVPLGYGEVYAPAYHCSPAYFNRVNVSNTTIVKTVNITNVYNTVYVNKTVYNQRYVNIQAPNAVTAMPQTAFASGRSVSQAGAAIPAARVNTFQPQAAALVAPPVAPARQALLASNISRPIVAHPPTQVAAQKVVVRSQPAVTPAPFANRQPYLQEHAGEPHDFPAMHQQVAQTASPAPPQYVKQTPVTMQAQPQQPRVPMRQPEPPQVTTTQHAPGAPAKVQEAPPGEGQPHNSGEVQRPATTVTVPHPPARTAYPAREQTAREQPAREQPAKEQRSAPPEKPKEKDKK